MIDNAFQAIVALDLDRIKLKLMHGTSGEGWSKGKATATETEYRRFLYLHSAFPDVGIVPTLDIDTFWHYHILDTRKYAADCERAFGHFLHHHPYLGLLDDDEPGIEIEAAKKTRELYEATFGTTNIQSESDDQRQHESLFLLTQASGNAPAQPATSSAAVLDEDICNNVAHINGVDLARWKRLAGAAPVIPRAVLARCQATCAVGAPAGLLRNASRVDHRVPR